MDRGRRALQPPVRQHAHRPVPSGGGGDALAGVRRDRERVAESIAAARARGGSTAELGEILAFLDGWYAALTATGREEAAATAA